MKRIARVALLAATAALLVLTCSALTGCGKAQKDVPNVINYEQSAAEKAITDAGLKVGDVTQDFSNTVTSGYVISQTPTAPAKADEGTTVALVVSKGKEPDKQADIPDVTGKTQTEAEKALITAGFVPMAGDPVLHDGTPAGTVFNQAPAAGTKAVTGTTVTFTASLGSGNVTVPNVTGKAEGDATDTLKNAGLGVDRTEAYSSSVAAGSVISQSVAADTSVAKGTRVVLNISLGAKPDTRIAVPDLMTCTQAEAQAALDSAGLTLKVTGNQDGVVLSQSPSAGAKVEKGSTVTVKLGMPLTGDVVAQEAGPVIPESSESSSASASASASASSSSAQ